MATQELKIARIGNSRGVRLPAAALQRYGMEGAVIMEERSDGILLRPLGPAPRKLSWEETAKAMAASGEDWSNLAALDADGLDTVPWESEEEAEKPAPRPAPAEPPVKRYEIRWAELDPVLGSEMAKRRPVVIVSLDLLNERLATVTICPVTSQLHPEWRTRLPVRCGGREAEIAADQIRTISKERLGRKLGTLSATEATALRRLLTEMYGE